MADETTFTIKTILNIFGSATPRKTILSAERSGLIPTAGRHVSGNVHVRRWPISDLPAIGVRYGFIKPLERPIVVTVFTSKGGVLKTTVSLNLARLAALHGVRVCVVGLDLQGDITNALGLSPDVDDADDLEQAFGILNDVHGLHDVFEQKRNLDQVIVDTELPTLKAIPETPDLEVMEQRVSTQTRREYWLRDAIIRPLKEQFDLVVIDCGPSWNLLVTNALTACDVLVSPLECKVTNFRNLTVFRGFTETFRRTMELNYEHIFVPTLLTSTRKLSSSIRMWYLTNIEGCTNGSIRESAKGEEAQGDRLSLPEFAPTSLVADEMRELIAELWARFRTVQAKQLEKVA